MKVLVAGGRGFIGTATVRALSAAGHDPGILEAGDGVNFVNFGGWDALVWAAGGRRATLDENRAEHVDAPGAVLAAMAATRVPSRLVYLSSGEAYGAQEVPFAEDAPLLGTSPYALAKIEGERTLAATCAARGVELTVLRPSVVFGPAQRGPMFLPSLLSALDAGERFAMTAGEQTRDMIHVDDVAAAIVAALGGPPGTYNVSTGVELTLRDLAISIATRRNAVHLLDIGALPYRGNEQMRYVLDPSRAMASLGWRPSRRSAAEFTGDSW